MSVFVDFDQWGRMGNRMFQYAFGYLLAKDKKTVLYSKGLPNFRIRGNTTGSPRNIICTRTYGNNLVNYKELVDLGPDNDIIVNSYLQRADYYTSRRFELQNLFMQPAGLPINGDSLVVHIRETDYKDIGIFLGYDFYKQAIKDSKFTKVLLVTDNSNCDTIKRLIADGCALYSEGYVDKFDHTCDNRSWQDFLCLLFSENILLSQSSFSWWAAFLGNHKKIIFRHL